MDNEIFDMEDESLVHLLEEGFNLRRFFNFLGAGETPEQRRGSNRRGLAVFRRYSGAIPTKESPLPRCIRPQCNHKMTVVNDSSRLLGWKYRCGGHTTRVTAEVLHNTFLKKARLAELGVDGILILMYYWLFDRQMVQALDEAHCSTDTAVAWYKHFRDVATKVAWHEYSEIGGADDVVEVDEAQIFQRKHHQGKMSTWNDLWVFGGISRKTKKMFAMLVPDRSADTLMPILIHHVDTDSYICSDQCNVDFASFGTFNNSISFLTGSRVSGPLWVPPGHFHEACLEPNCKHQPPLEGYQPFRKHIQTIERSLQELKRRASFCSSLADAPNYIGEFMYRKNILSQYSTKAQIFRRFLEDIGKAYPGLGRVPMNADVGNCECYICKPIEDLQV